MLKKSESVYNNNQSKLCRQFEMWQLKSGCDWDSNNRSHSCSRSRSRGRQHGSRCRDRHQHRHKQRGKLQHIGSMMGRRRMCGNTAQQSPDLEPLRRRKRPRQPKPKGPVFKTKTSQILNKFFFQNKYTFNNNYYNSLYVQTTCSWWRREVFWYYRRIAVWFDGLKSLLFIPNCSSPHPLALP